jgi:hypothetical protein
MDDDRDFSHLDPKNLLPFVCQLEPDDPNAVIVPKTYIYIQPPEPGDNYI